MPSSACKKSALRSEEHTSELQSHSHFVCRLLLEKKKTQSTMTSPMPYTAVTTNTRCTYAHTLVASRLSCFFLLIQGPPRFPLFLVVFFFNDTATTEIYTLSLHDALPISVVDRKSTRLNSSHTLISYAVS